MKIAKIIFGALLALGGVAMGAYAFYFFFQEDTAIICLASLYVAMLISFIVIVCGLSIIAKKEKDK